MFPQWALSLLGSPHETAQMKQSHAHETTHILGGLSHRLNPSAHVGAEIRYSTIRKDQVDTQLPLIYSVHVLLFAIFEWMPVWRYISHGFHDWIWHGSHFYSNITAVICASPLCNELVLTQHRWDYFHAVPLHISTTGHSAPKHTTDKIDKKEPPFLSLVTYYHSLTQHLKNNLNENSLLFVFFFFSRWNDDMFGWINKRS